MIFLLNVICESIANYSLQIMVFYILKTSLLNLKIIKAYISGKIKTSKYIKSFFISTMYMFILSILAIDKIYLIIFLVSKCI